jgi:AcrR family transcriptional regulator
VSTKPHLCGSPQRKIDERAELSRMPVLINTRDRAHHLAWIIAQLLAEQGVAALTMRRIADASRLSTSSLVHHWGGKERLLGYALVQTRDWRLENIEDRVSRKGVAAFLPCTAPNSYGIPDDSMVLARAWQAWREHCRTQAAFADTGARARRQERWLLGRAIGGDLSDEQLDGAYALLEGLVMAVCAPVSPMPRERAVAILEEHCELIRGRHPQAS